MTAIAPPAELEPDPDQPAPSCPPPRYSGAPGITRRTWTLALAAVLVLVAGSLWLIDGGIDKPYLYDDVNFILGARAVADTVYPRDLDGAVRRLGAGLARPERRLHAHRHRLRV
jgi:hypothetical protein